MAQQDPDSHRMSLGDHLEDLRRRIILGLIGPLVMAVVMLFFGKQLIGVICVPLLLALHHNDQTPQVYAVTALVGFSVYLKVSLISGLILGMPWLLWHLWKFVSLGLYPHERRFVGLLVPGSAVLSMTGVLFMYFIMLPVMLMFLIGFAVNYPTPDYHNSGYFNWLYGRMSSDAGPSDTANAPDAAAPLARLPILTEDPPGPGEGQVWVKLPEQQLRVVIGGQIHTLALQKSGLLSPELRIGEYIGMVVWLGLAFALSFQLPLVMLLLAATGLVDAKRMARVRRYALFVCCILGALLTPADPVSMVLLAVPMYVLYELGLVLARVARRRDEPNDAEA